VVVGAVVDLSHWCHLRGYRGSASGSLLLVEPAVAVMTRARELCNHSHCCAPTTRNQVVIFFAYPDHTETPDPMARYCHRPTGSL
jgi:hypothetical protein